VRDADGLVDLAATMAAVPGLVDAGVTNVSLHLKVLDPRLEDPVGRCSALVGAFRAAL